MGIVETVTQPLYQAANDWDCFADKFEPSFRRNFLIAFEVRERNP